MSFICFFCTMSVLSRMQGNLMKSKWEKTNRRQGKEFKRRDGKDIWWFEMSGEEDILAELELTWKHNYWKIERVHRHSRSISEET